MCGRTWGPGLLAVRVPRRSKAVPQDRRIVPDRRAQMGEPVIDYRLLFRSDGVTVGAQNQQVVEASHAAERTEHVVERGSVMGVQFGAARCSPPKPVAFSMFSQQICDLIQVPDEPRQPSIEV
jgi:hypothetical protein